MSRNLLIAKPWNANSKYKVGDIVTNEGAYYINKSGINNNVKTSPFDWLYLGETNRTPDNLFMKLVDWTNNGKIRTDKLEAIALTRAIKSIETTIDDFITNSANYTFEEGDFIAIPQTTGPDAYYIFYYYNGVDKSIRENYLKTGISNIPMSMVDGLIDALNSKIDKPISISPYYLNYWNSTELKSSSAFFDETNNRIGIGTNTPSQQLEITERIKSKGLILNENNESVNNQITYFNRAFWGKTVGDNIRAFMFKDYNELISLFESLTAEQLILTRAKLFNVIPTIEDLRTYNAEEGDLITLNGYYTSGDKSPLVYKFTLLDYATLIDDEGSVIKTDSGSWIAQFNGIVDARDYGCSQSLTDNSVKFNKMIKNANSNQIVVNGLNLKFTNPIVINKRVKITGVMRSTIYDFTALGANIFGFRLCTSAAINNLEINGGMVLGNNTCNLMRVNENNNAAFALTDSIFTNLRFQDFNIGTQSNYMWSNLFLNCRWQGCIEPLLLDAQTNNTLFSACRIVTFKRAIRLTNCEGIEFSTCNIANFNVNNESGATQSFISLSQSNCIITNPYWENLSNGVLSVGGSSEVADAKSSLTVIGGKATDTNVRIKINGTDNKISLRGLNNKGGQDIYVLENADNTLSPTNYVRELYVDNKQYSANNIIAKFDGNQPWSFGTFGGGASNSITAFKGFKTIQMNGPFNTGFRVTNSLQSGQYYILAYMINKNTATGNLNIRCGTDYQTLKIQNLNDNYEIRFVPFKAFATNLDLSCTVSGDSFDIRYIAIFKGNYISDSYEKTYIPHSSGMPTSISSFSNGDLVKDSSIGDTFYALSSGVWKTLRIVGKNEAGQVKVNYTGLNTVNFVAETPKQLNIGSATPTVVASPTTIYPASTPNNYTGVFDSARNGGTTTYAGRLIENPINGQSHTFRIQGSYSNKASGNNGSLDIVLRNPVSGFISTRSITLPSGRTTGNFDEAIVVIADTASIPTPNGYILEVLYSFTDANLTINVTSITRFSSAIEP